MMLTEKHFLACPLGVKRAWSVPAERCARSRLNVLATLAIVPFVASAVLVSGVGAHAQESAEHTEPSPIEAVEEQNGTDAAEQLYTSEAESLDDVSDDNEPDSEEPADELSLETDSEEAGLARSMMQPLAANDSPLTCEPGYFYAITSGSGSVMEMRVDPASPESLANLNIFDEGPRIPNLSNSGPFVDANGNEWNAQANGLAITDRGRTVYFFDRYTTNNGKDIVGYDKVPFKIRKWQAGRGVETVVDNFNPADTGSGPKVVGSVAGAANPVQDEGYYFGGYSLENSGSREEWVPGRSVWGYDRTGQYENYYDSSTQRWYHWVPGYWETVTVKRPQMNIWRYLNGQVEYVGFVPINAPYGATMNGDIAFNQNGDVFILYHSGDQVRIVSASKEALDSAKGGEIKAAKPNELTLPLDNGLQVNGIAFNDDGRLFIQTSGTHATAGPRQYLWDPNTGALSRPFEMRSFTAGTDLASCVEFPTISLQKDVKNRAEKTDQFGLRIERIDSADSSKSTVVSQNTTTGTATGIQEEQAGPVPAVPSAKYRLIERGAVTAGSSQEGANLSNYETDFECTARDSNGLELESVDLALEEDKSAAHLERAWTLTMPTIQDLRNHLTINCIYTNEPNKGAVSWQKVGEDKALLGGSEWTLRSVDADSEFEPLKIEECIANSAQDCAGADKDPEEGKFRIDSLPFGNYELVETKAPEGYRKLAEPIRFKHEHGGDKHNADENISILGDIVNTKGGVLIWTKEDGNGALLGGSEWSLTVKEKDPIKVVDNTGQDNYEGRDIDERPGYFKVKDLALGEYELRETKAPDGYRKLEGVVETVVIDDVEKDIEVGPFENFKLRLDWNKVDAANPDGDPLAGSVWELELPDGSVQEIQDCEEAPCAADGDLNSKPGEFTVATLSNGKYTLKEKKAPEGYIRIEDEVAIEVFSDGYSLNGGEKKQFPKASEGEIHLEFGDIKNTKDAVSVKWEKKDPQGEYIGPSEWTLVQITGKGGSEVDGGLEKSVVDNGDSDEDSDLGKITVKDLPAGWYRLIETKAPDGFNPVDADGKKITKDFELTKDMALKSLIFDAGAFENQPTKVTWTKVDEDGKALAGSQWCVVPKESQADESCTHVVKDKFGSEPGLNDENNEAGKFTVEGLKFGTYRLVETAAPEGYVISDAAKSGYEFTLSAENPTYEFKDAIENKKQLGGVTWTKYQKGNENLLLEGSEWRIVATDKDGGDRTEGTDDIVVTDCSSAPCSAPDKDPAKGQFRVEGLELGWYYLVEEKAPVGYKLDPTKHYFELTADNLANGDVPGLVVAGSFENELGKGIKLPLTGGMGAYKFLLTGSILGLLSAVLGGMHVMRRRNS
ncbi:SpaA isopeptide-forming pilin-related protein [Corynebacterium striatum]